MLYHAIPSGVHTPLTCQSLIVGLVASFLWPWCRLQVAIGITARFVVRHDLSEDEAVQASKSVPVMTCWAGFRVT